jgi:hypothetical protein
MSLVNRISKSIFIGLFATLSASTIFAQSQTTTIGLPTSKGKSNFIFKLLNPLAEPVKSLVLFASPKIKEASIAEFLMDAEAKQFSKKNNCAFVQVLTESGIDTMFAQLSSSPELKLAIETAINDLETRTGISGLKNAAIVPVGFSAASRFAISIASAMPGKTAGLATLLAYNLSSNGGGSIAKIPHLVTTGENSGPDVRNNESVFFSEQIRKAALARRAKGELIHHSVEMNASQSTLKRKGIDLLFAFVAKTISYRIGPDFNPAIGPVSLLPIVEANGYLGQNAKWEGFTENQIQTSNYSPSAASSSFWLFDSEYAKTWRTFQVSSFASFQIIPGATPVVPYCTGQLPSALTAIIQMNAGVQLQGNNYYRVEVSDITGNFDNPTYPTRYTGSKLSVKNSDTLKQTVIFPDNLAYANQSTINGVKRYKMRVVSTNPVFESASTPEIANISTCGADDDGVPFVYLSTIRPYKKFYNRGDVLTFSVIKPATYTIQPGTTVRVDLSGRNYRFAPGFSTTLLAPTLLNLSSAAIIDSVVFSVTLPDTLSFGPRYRLKPFLSSFEGNKTAGNGHDITVIPNTSGNQISITTTTVNAIGQNTAQSGGTIFSDGGNAISVRGVCWNTSPSPTVFLSTKTTDGNGVGEYESTLSNLSPGTLYYVRAYATNSQGTAYGEERTFTTVAAPQVPVLTTQSIYGILETTAKGGGRITNPGGSEITAKGLCWATTTGPTLDNFSVAAGVDTSSFTNTSLTGLVGNTTYYVRAYATNSTGTGYGNEVVFTSASAQAILAQILIQNINPATITAFSAKATGTIPSDGGSPVTSRGFVWDVNSGPTIALTTQVISGSGTGIFGNVTLSPLQPNTLYYVRAFATNGIGTSYSEEVTFTTLAGSIQLAEVTIANINSASITSTSVEAGGTIVSDGGSAVTDRGLVWDVNPVPTIALPTKISSGSGIGSFSNVVISPLTPGTTYFIRAFATNSVGTSYSAEISFITVSVLKTSGGIINLTLHPNPVTDVTFLSADLPVNRAKFLLYGTDGKQIETDIEQVSDRNFKISTSGLRSGVYFLKVSLNGGTKTLKIVK